MKKIFECNMTEEYAKWQCYDDWGCAFVWNEKCDYGVEYNACIQEDGTNCSAIYFIYLNYYSDYMDCDFSTFEHYEIDWNDSDWKEKLENKMNEVLEKFMANKKKIMTEITTYNKQTITKCGNGYTVFFEGDELYFDTIEEAQQFIIDNF